MSQTLTIRLTDKLAAWLEESAARTGVSRAQVVREQLEKARIGLDQKPFMRLAGTLAGDRDLSRRKEFCQPPRS